MRSVFLCSGAGAHEGDEWSQGSLGNVYADAFTGIVGEEECLAHGADAEDASSVDDMLSAQANDVVGRFSGSKDRCLYSGKTERNHEGFVCIVIDMGIVVIGLKVDDLVQIQHKEFIVCSEANPAVFHIRP